VLRADPEIASVLSAFSCNRHLVAVRHTRYVGNWVAAVIQLRVVRIQMYIHVMVLNRIDAVLCISNEFQISYRTNLAIANC